MFLPLDSRLFNQKASVILSILELARARGPKQTKSVKLSRCDKNSCSVDKIKKTEREEHRTQRVVAEEYDEETLASCNNYVKSKHSKSAESFYLRPPLCANHVGRQPCAALRNRYYCCAVPQLSW